MTNPRLSAGSLAVAQVLREKRAGARVKYAAITDATGIDKASLSAILNGRRTMSVEQFLAICRAIGVPVSDVMREAERRTGISDAARAEVLAIREEAIAELSLRSPPVGDHRGDAV